MTSEPDYQYRSSSTLTFILTVLLFVRAFIVFGTFFYITLLVERGFNLPKIGTTAYLRVYLSANFLSVIVFCVWVFRSCINAHALSLHHPMMYRPRWAVGCFFIPIVNLVVPRRVLAAIWNNSATNPKLEGTYVGNKLVNLWWTLWISVVILVQVITLVEASQAPRLVIITTHAIGLLFTLVFIYVWFHLINKVCEMQELKFFILTEMINDCSNCGEPMHDTSETACPLCGEPFVLPESV